jgi:hypothetical protein
MLSRQHNPCRLILAEAARNGVQARPIRPHALVETLGAGFGHNSILFSHSFLLI